MTGHPHHEPGASAPSADAVMDRAWREASDEQPPAALDAAILAAAHAAPSTAGDPRGDAAAAGGRPARRFRQWQPLAVAASVAGLAFVLVQVLPREPQVATRESIQREMSAREPVPPDVAAQRSVPPAVATPGPVPAADTAHESMRSSDAAADVVAATPAATELPEKSLSATAGPAAAEMSAPPVAVEGEAGTARVPAMESAPAPASAAKAAAGAAAATDAARALEHEALRPDPAAWADRIARLHAAGDFVGAATSLRSFRANYARADDYLVPELRDWARSVE